MNSKSYFCLFNELFGLVTHLVFTEEDVKQIVPAGMPEVLRVRVYGAGVPVPGCGVLSLCSDAESSDRPAAAGAHRQAHVRCG